jgi:endonuclease/exonuclease/phosphatase family metal-dependent hydrolase
VALALARVVLDRDPVPLAVTTNEICSGQYDALADALATAGFSAAAAWSIPAFEPEKGCASYGNAVFWRGGRGDVECFVYPDDLQADGVATREKRTLIRAVSATLPFAIATTHPAPRDAIAAGQVSAAAAWLAERTDVPTVLAGDLNLPPRRRALDVFYADHEEADRWPRRFPRPTHVGLRKLDYVFVPRNRMRVRGGLSITFHRRLSDHARLAAEIEETRG